MANIVLKNRSNEEQTYEGVEAVVLNTDTGETATFVGESLIPEPYVHPDTHPASMITGLAKVATSGDYNHLVNKPCYQSPRLESSSLTFSKDDEMGDYGATVEGFFQLEVGDSYTVNWDGTDYACTVKDPSEQGIGIGMLYLGNLQRFWNSGLGEDTGEPFVLAVSNDDFTKLSIETNQEGSHTVALTPAKAVHPLGAEYLPESAATKSWVKAQIAASGGSGGSGDIPERVIFNREITTETADGSVDLLDEASLPLISWLLGGGAERYTVIFDGETYTLTPQTVAEAGATLVFIGNSAITGAEETEEPFVIGAVQESGVFIYGAIITAEAGTHTLTVSVPITAENNYVPTLDFTEWGSVAFGGVLEEEDLSTMGEAVLPWMLHSKQIQVKFLYKVSDTETTPMIVRISDIMMLPEQNAASAAVWIPIGENWGIFEFMVSQTEGVILCIADSGILND